MGVLVRPTRSADAAALAEILNAIIAQGGTTALEEPFSAEALDHAYLTGPDVLCCFTARADDSPEALGFQTLGRYPSLPPNCGDIGTFVRIGVTQGGVGTALFAATRARARALGLAGINATIRADNTGGLRFYSRMGFIDHSVAPAVPLRSGLPVDRINKRYTLA